MYLVSQILEISPWNTKKDIKEIKQKISLELEISNWIFPLGKNVKVVKKTF